MMGDQRGKKKKGGQQKTRKKKGGGGGESGVGGEVGVPDLAKREKKDARGRKRETATNVRGKKYAAPPGENKGLAGRVPQERG